MANKKNWVPEIIDLLSASPNHQCSYQTIFHSINSELQSRGRNVGNLNEKLRASMALARNFGLVSQSRKSAMVKLKFKPRMPRNKLLASYMCGKKIVDLTGNNNDGDSSDDDWEYDDNYNEDDGTESDDFSRRITYPELCQQMPDKKIAIASGWTLAGWFQFLYIKLINLSKMLKII